MRYPRIGQLRHLVTVQSEEKTPDGMGGYSLSWTDGATFWARIEPISGREQLQAMQLQENITHRIHCRERTDVSAGKRLKFGSRVFNVRAAFDIHERGRYLEIMAEEGVAT